MVTVFCSKQDCTIADTGTCLESFEDPISDCQFYSEKEVEGVEPSLLHTSTHEASQDIGTQSTVRQFHPALELGMEDVIELMRTRYTHLIGILGSWNAGKTCFLSSLYLLAIHGLLPEYLFTWSLTLRGFEERARGVRKWKEGILPEKLVDHTVLQDERSPAFMHLALRERRSGRRVDLLLTDLPGEWSKRLIERVDASERFSFLQRADGIVIVIEGPLLESSESRNPEVRKGKLLLQRLAENVSLDRTIPLVLLVSKCDLLGKLGKELPSGVEEVANYAIELGFTPKIVLATAFSTNPSKVESGTGIADTIKAIIDHELPLAQQLERELNSNRAFGRFRLYEPKE
jgi:GTPase SAR1 family protein